MELHARWDNIFAALLNQNPETHQISPYFPHQCSKHSIMNKYRNIKMTFDHYSPNLTFFPSVYCSCRGLLRCSRGAGVERVISLWGIPRSSSRVLIWPWNSRLQGCLRTATKCSFRFFRTLLTWDLARVGGRFAKEVHVHSVQYVSIQTNDTLSAKISTVKINTRLSVWISPFVSYLCQTDTML